MFYVFHQNNSYGKYLPPAREIAIEADSEDEAREIYRNIEGVYFKSTSDKDCQCCGPRWGKIGLDYTPEEFDQYMKDQREYKSWLSPKVPYILIQYRDGRRETVGVEQTTQKVDIPQDAPLPMPEVDSGQESAAPVESES